MIRQLEPPDYRRPVIYVDQKGNRHRAFILTWGDALNPDLVGCKMAGRNGATFSALRNQLHWPEPIDRPWFFPPAEAKFPLAGPPSEQHQTGWPQRRVRAL